MNSLDRMPTKLYAVATGPSGRKELVLVMVNSDSDNDIDPSRYSVGKTRARAGRAARARLFFQHIGLYNQWFGVSLSPWAPHGNLGHSLVHRGSN